MSTNSSGIRTDSGVTGEKRKRPLPLVITSDEKEVKAKKAKPVAPGWCVLQDVEEIFSASSKKREELSSSAVSSSLGAAPVSDVSAGAAGGKSDAGIKRKISGKQEAGASASVAKKQKGKEKEKTQKKEKEKAQKKEKEKKQKKEKEKKKEVVPVDVEPSKLSDMVQQLFDAAAKVCFGSSFDPAPNINAQFRKRARQQLSDAIATAQANTNNSSLSSAFSSSSPPSSSSSAPSSPTSLPAAVTPALELENFLYNRFFYTARSLYSAKLRSLVFNLQKNAKYLLDNFSLSSLCSFPTTKLAENTDVDRWRREQQAKSLSTKQSGADTVIGIDGGTVAQKGMFMCPKCKSWNTDYTQKQTRSADEPMTSFVTCFNPMCNNKFKR